MLIILSAETGGVCIVSHATIAVAPVGIASVEFTTAFSLATKIIKKSLSTTRNKKNSLIKFLCLLKVNSIALKL